MVSAGDLIGASPLISALFHDEPTIEAMNLIGLDIAGVGNHEFDEGSAELLRMQNGGSHPDGDLDGDGFDGADFEFLSANVVVDATGKTLFPAYTVKQYNGVKVAFIGMTLEGTPTIVTPSGVAGLTFEDEVDTVNALVPDATEARHRVHRDPPPRGRLLQRRARGRRLPRRPHRPAEDRSSKASTTQSTW